MALNNVTSCNEWALQFRKKEQGAANLAHSYGRILQAKLAIKGNPAVSGVASIFMVVDLTIYATECALSDQFMLGKCSLCKSGRISNNPHRIGHQGPIP
jgi:hypothetical protein